MEDTNLNKEYSELIDHYYNVLTSDNPQAEQLKLIISLLKTKSKLVYQVSKSENFHWSFCSFRTFSNTYIVRLNAYLDMNDDESCDEVDFVKNELRVLNFFLKSDYLNFIDDSIIQKVKDETQKKITYLQSKLSPEKNVEKKAIEIFTSEKAEELFNLYLEDFENDSKVLAKISFIYRIMFHDGYINEYARPEIFKNEIGKPPYEITIEHSLKNLDTVKTIIRLNRYMELKKQVFNKT